MTHINNISDIFEEIVVSFQNSKIGSKIGELPIYDSTFGILNMKAKSVAVTTKSQDFVFSIDNSGSMSDVCSDGRTKMRHILHTLKNMIHYFNDNHLIHANITVFTFEDTVCKIIERMCVTTENIRDIISMIDTIRPMSSTNIEAALISSKEYITELKTLYPNTEISHIFMTDGDATSGSTDHIVLRQHVDRSVNNAFIGVGIEHDSTLLNLLGGNTNCSYHFIDKLETAGFVYGEILHEILYKSLKNGELEIKNGLIYNYKSNLWTNKLAIGDIIGESDKTYHIISDNPACCIITISGTNYKEDIRTDYNTLVFFDEDINNNNDNNNDITKYIFRQRTLQLLFEINEFETEKLKKSSFDSNTNNITSGLARGFNSGLSINTLINNQEINQKESNLKAKLREFITEIKNYINNNHLTNDKFLKNLCDDIYISYKTMGSKYGKMYTCARQTSQGTQRCYNVTETPNMRSDHISQPVLRRQVAYDIDNENMGNELFHEVSNYADTPYTTPQATQVMGAISGNIWDDEDEDEDEDDEDEDEEDEYELLTQKL
jgi:hypothetical protein